MKSNHAAPSTSIHNDDGEQMGAVQHLWLLRTFDDFSTHLFLPKVSKGFAPEHNLVKTTLQSGLAPRRSTMKRAWCLHSVNIPAQSQAASPHSRDSDFRAAQEGQGLSIYRELLGDSMLMARGPYVVKHTSRKGG